MKFISADQVHNGYAFFPEGSVLVLNDNGKVLDVKPVEELDRGQIRFYRGILCPGMVNTHCHLELSYLRGKLSEGRGLHEFIREIEGLKRPADEEVSRAITDASREMFESGIVAVGDICNTNSTFPLKENSGIYYHNFLEVYAFDPGRAEAAFLRGVKLAGELEVKGLKNYSITPHAPYSSSLALLKKIADFAGDHHSILSIHNQENEDENLLFRNKTGKILDRLNQFGIDTQQFKPTGKNSLPSVLVHLPRDIRLMLVHNTFTNEEDIEFAMEYNKDISWCLCPNANRYIEGRLPPVDLLAARCSNRITLGTDSYASNHRLSLTEEINTLLTGFPGIKLAQLLKWATINGARFLGIEETYGSFEKGKMPGVTQLLPESESRYVSKRIL